ncbi:tumor protein p63-regulated gene 1-like protein isoform X1 [Mytilus californianus]|uniref:tumor protein p63-regulated gene 1-like protein isoform X1 n=1 Tax=Mytilus californianus TaxID=6549 RepID=UPI002246C7EF|nr:tumor protein p63-regulated gene 1-like protein isoform X1 [Mytilus californianus]
MADGTHSQSNFVDEHLDDDKPPGGKEFKGATLQIDAPSTQNGEEPGVGYAGPGSNFNRNRPGSVIGRQSVRSTSSRTSMRPGVVKTERMSDQYFSYKESNFDKAVDKCKEVMKEDLDGKILGKYLLTEIDHWNNEREKIILLTEGSILVFKYNFILNKLEEWRRLLLHMVDHIAIGDFKYPDKSLMPLLFSDREHGGIQIRWNKNEEPGWAQKWNPFCTTLPYMTFSHHPVLYNPKENETVTYNVDEFYEHLVQAVSESYKKKRPGEKVTILEGPILIESYASLSSLIYNQSGLGFFMDRNGICF